MRTGDHTRLMHSLLEVMTTRVRIHHCGYITKDMLLCTVGEASSHSHLIAILGWKFMYVCTPGVQLVTSKPPDVGT